MNPYSRTLTGTVEVGQQATKLPKNGWFCRPRVAGWVSLVALMTCGAHAQVNVVTKHNDIGRTGQNLNETILTPNSVSNGFGQLFSQSVTGSIYAQPLYMSQVTIPGKGVHNVLYVATGSDYVYAFDADNNGGINATPLWQVALAANLKSSGTYNSLYGVYGTPVIDPTTNTLYVVSSEDAPSTSTYILRLHALDITTGAEKFGGPVLIQGSVPGTGTGSVSGVLSFDPQFQLQRAGLLLMNGVVYVPFGAIADNGTWHGWIFSFNAATLANTDIYCTTPNGGGGGIWMAGAGLAGDQYSTSKPYGRLFFATGNGSYAANLPYDKTMNYSMTVQDLDVTGGKFTVEDEFTPYNWQVRNAQDGDLGSGGPMVLPTQTLASGKTLKPLIEVGKTGTIFILDRDNNTDGSNNPATEYSPAGMGGFNSSADQVVQEVQTPPKNAGGWGNGIWGSEAYWNGNIYYGGLGPGSTNGMVAYSFVNGALSTAPTSQTVEQFSYPGPTPSVSANGTTNGIVWLITHGTNTLGSGVLQAYDATDLGTLLYSSTADAGRDTPGAFVEFSVPTIANGKVYVNAQGGVSIYGLLGSTPTVAPPVISPGGGTFTGSQSVTITDTTPGANIYYTINGTTPTVGSSIYSGPIKITASETVTAIASATGYLQGKPVSAVFSSTANAANPVFSLAAGSYSGTQRLTITDSSPNSVIYYTVDGTTPTTASATYTGTFSVPASETIQAVASSSGLLTSSVVSAAYTIEPPYTINFTQGFAQSQLQGLMQFNGSTDLDDFRLQLTNGGLNEAGSAFFTTPVPTWAFTTDFTFQLSNPVGDGIAFVIQDNSPTALGANGRNLGYGGMPNSLAIKFDMYNNVGEGNDSTGMYLNGTTPTLPSIDLTNTGINLRSGDYMNVHITYDDKVLNLTITDAITQATWSHSFLVNIPYHVGATAYVGFTGSTGGVSASQKLTSWTFVPGPPAVPSFPAGFDPADLTLTGSSALNGTNLELTDGRPSEVTSAFYSAPVPIDAFTSDFDFTVEPGTTSTLADGFMFVIQNASQNAIGGTGAGLGYSTIPDSVGIKFDLFNSSGQGNDSTGAYVNGAMPTMPSIDLNPSGLLIYTGHQIHVHVTYDGTTLIWAIHDLIHENSTIKQMVVDIPHVIGSNTAYIGFTAASGDGTAIQNILDWTFSNP